MTKLKVVPTKGVTKGKLRAISNTVTPKPEPVTIAAKTLVSDEPLFDKTNEDMVFVLLCKVHKQYTDTDYEVVGTYSSLDKLNEALDTIVKQSATTENDVLETIGDIRFTDTIYGIISRAAEKGFCNVEFIYSVTEIDKDITLQ